ncbi:hypothetical protein EDD11_004478 [Mortierella claussenii]|nr:hypothetical protein EDD11_004478 [Mortierella claussenii]
MFASRVTRFYGSATTLFSSSPVFANAGRHILKSIYAAERPEGMGAIVRRSLGTRELRHHDPFLLLDEFYLNTKGGFPDHPHRGFETITYMLSGQMQHQDFSDHQGTIGPGDLQWMTAGRGIVHCEMPVKDKENDNTTIPPLASSGGGEGEAPHDQESLTIHGLQLWVNLSHKDKTCDPAYQDLRNHQIPRVYPLEGVEVKVIAGEAHDVKSKVYTRTPVMYLDYKMDKSKSVDLRIPKYYEGFVYMLCGKAYFGDGPIKIVSDREEYDDGEGQPVDASKNHVRINQDPSKPFEGRPHHALILSQDEEQDGEQDTLHIQTDQDEGAHFVVLAGQPLKEPVVQDRLFVLNSKEGVRQALEDFREAKNGFENAQTWRSTIAPRGYRLKF